MKCPQIQMKLEEIAFGSTINAQAHETLRSHLDGCTSCTESASELLLLASLTKGPALSPPPQWEARLREQIKTKEAGPRFAFRQAAAALILITVGVAGGFWLRPDLSAGRGDEPQAEPVIRHIVYEPAMSALDPAPKAKHTYEPFAYSQGFLSGKTARIVRD